LRAIRLGSRSHRDEEDERQSTDGGHERSGAPPGPSADARSNVIEIGHLLFPRASAAADRGRLGMAMPWIDDGEGIGVAPIGWLRARRAPHIWTALRLALAR
jgi:hypothetical protein